VGILLIVLWVSYSADGRRGKRECTKRRVTDSPVSPRWHRCVTAVFRWHPRCAQINKRIQNSSVFIFL